MGIPTLDDGHLLLCCLAIAVKLRDEVLVRQVAAKADRVLSEAQLKRTFSRIKGYGMTEEDMSWLGELSV